VCIGYITWTAVLPRWLGALLVYSSGHKGVKGWKPEYVEVRSTRLAVHANGSIEALSGLPHSLLLATRPAIARCDWVHVAVRYVVYAISAASTHVILLTRPNLAFVQCCSLKHASVYKVCHWHRLAKHSTDWNHCSLLIIAHQSILL
jgi:hypothetical protein